MARRYTTIEIAKAAGVPRATLQYWISVGKIAAPKVQRVNGKAVRFWAETDVMRIRQMKGTLKPGPGPFGTPPPTWRKKRTKQ